jgi:hypothetical protein
MKQFWEFRTVSHINFFEDRSHYERSTGKSHIQNPGTQSSPSLPVASLVSTATLVLCKNDPTRPALLSLATIKFTTLSQSGSYDSAQHTTLSQSGATTVHSAQHTTLSQSGATTVHNTQRYHKVALRQCTTQRYHKVALRQCTTQRYDSAQHTTCL